MFEDMHQAASDQFHQFIVSSRNYGSNPSFSTSFDPFAAHQLQLQLESAINNNKVVDDQQQDQEEQTTTSLISSTPESSASWSHDEVVALLRIRSNIENWFSDFTWEHVSRKLAELGFKRSADKCKEKFEEESLNFNKNIFEDDDDQLCHQNQEDGESERTVTAAQDQNGEESKKPSIRDINNKKRKRRDKIEMFKCFCEAIVSKIMAQQEELHNKLIQEMVKRDEAQFARDEAWKNQHMERINKEIQTRAQEQATAGERQAIIVQFLKKFVSDDEDDQFINKIQQESQDHKTEAANTSSSMHVLIQQNPNSAKTQDEFEMIPLSSSSSSRKINIRECEESGNRWPRDQVLALINLRCKLNKSEEIKEGTTKGPLWERISQGMFELGYKRSAKRCKEKWENINKYFRKTKDSSKKRSIDSRTCPYFHHLSSLYSQGTPETQQ